MPTTEYGVDQFFQNAGTSPKMVYDVAGVLGWSPHNLVLQSAAGRVGFLWQGSGATVVGGQADPLGGTEALQVTTTAHTGTNVSPQGPWFPVAVSGVTYVASMWCKGPVGQQIYFVMDDTTTAAMQKLITFTGDWQRVFHTYTTISAGQKYIAFETYNRSGGAHLPFGTFTVWGGQYQRGTTPTAYLPTTTATRFGLALDYDPVTHAAKGLLCEPAATNIFANNSNDLSVQTAEGGAVTVNNQTGPDGLLTADTFTENTATFNHGCYGAIGVIANTDYTLSRFMKMGTRRYSSLGWSDGTNGAYAVYDLQTGVVGSSAAFGTGTLNSASIQAGPNGWYRCIVSGKFPTGTTAYYTQQAATAATITVDGFGRQSFLGTGATLFMGHVQIEAGTVATSPIPTLAASVTRAADRYNVTPASIGYSATAGSWWVDVSMNIAGDGTSPRVIGYQASASTPLYVDTTQFGIYDGNLVTKIIPSTLGAHKAAMAFANADRAITADGLAVSTNTAAGIALGTPGTAIGFGSDPNGAPYMNGYIRKVRYLPRRPSNAELQTMTT